MIDIKLESPDKSYNLIPKYDFFKSNQSISIKKEYLKNERYIVQFWDVTKDYHSLLGLEKDYKEIENFCNQNNGKVEFENEVTYYKSILKSVSKYRGGQKIIEYSKDEFYEKFEIVKDFKEDVAEDTKVELSVLYDDKYKLFVLEPIFNYNGFFKQCSSNTCMKSEKNIDLNNLKVDENIKRSIQHAFECFLNTYGYFAYKNYKKEICYQ